MLKLKISMVVVLCLCISGISHGRVIEEDLVRSKGEIHVAVEDTVLGDVKLKMGNVAIDGVVNGDVECKMGNITIDGTVNGDILCKMGEIIINGTVNGDVKVKVGEIKNRGAIKGETIEVLKDKTKDLEGITEKLADTIVDEVLTEIEKALEDIESELIIEKIEVVGAANISEDAILDTIGIRIGAILDVEELIRVKEELQALRRFKTVKIKILKDDSVGIEIRVEENPLVEKVEVEGNTVFSTDSILKELAITSGEVLKGSIEEKKDIVEAMYHDEGYNLAQVTPFLEGTVLIFGIDEGRIDEIEVTGNKRVGTDVILKTLDVKKGDLYNKNELRKRLKELSERFPIEADATPRGKGEMEVQAGEQVVLKMVIGEEEEDSTVVETGEDIEQGYAHEEITEEHGKNVLNITVEEKNLLKLGMGAAYSRVQGVALSGKLQTRVFLPNELKVKIMGGYAFAPKLWEYGVTAEKEFFYPHSLNIGGEYRNKVDTQDEWRLSGLEESLSSLLLRQGYWDYYTREGWGAWLSQVIIPGHTLKVQYDTDEYGSIEERDVWSLFNGGKAWRENPSIDDGQINSVTGSYTCKIGNENHKMESTMGVEKAGGDELGGEFEFTRYVVDMKGQNQLSASNFLDFRVMAGYSGEVLPMQRRFHLGGIGSLRGYGYKEFSGNTMLLGNLEYRIGSKSPQLALLFDVGNAWENGEDVNLRELKSSIGVGLRSFGEGFSFSIHRRLDRGEAPLYARLRIGTSLCSFED
jgi:outer membrane protein insertion porin family